jgi:hypothetical protein
VSRAPGEWLTQDEAAARYGITVAAVRRAIRTGRLPMEVDEQGRRIVQGWRAAELWENVALKRQGLRRCVKCQEIQPLEDFAVGRPGVRRKVCRGCWRPMAARLQKRWRKSASGRMWMKAWYGKRGGQWAYRRRGMMARRLKVLQGERG